MVIGIVRLCLLSGGLLFVPLLAFICWQHPVKWNMIFMPQVGLIARVTRIEQWLSNFVVSSVMHDGVP
jgi:hypothetical protein